MNTAYVYDSAQVGELKPKLLFANGPTSYASTGDPVYNPATGAYINFPMGCISQSGNYEVRFIPTSTGVGGPYIRAGAPAVTQSGWVARYFATNSGGGSGVAKVSQNVAGSGMTPGTYPITFSGGTGSGAAGTVTVTATTVTSATITSPGSYTVAPTATIGGSPGGTPATLTVTMSTAGGEVPTGANLSAEKFQFGAFVSEL